jgi:hypothetical protein
MVGCEGPCGNIYFIPGGETYSPACCWWLCCFGPTCRSASCRRAARRSCWKCVPPHSRRRCPRSMRTTTREVTASSRTVLLVAHPPPGRFLTSSPLNRRRPSFPNRSTPANPRTSAYDSRTLISLAVPRLSRKLRFSGSSSAVAPSIIARGDRLGGRGSFSHDSFNQP